MTCHEFVDGLASYLDEDLPYTQQRLFDEHLSACSDCSVYLDSLNQTRTLAKVACHHLDDPAPAEWPEKRIATQRLPRLIARVPLARNRITRRGANDSQGEPFQW